MAQNRWKMRIYRFLQVKPICNFVFRIRFLFYARLLRRVRIHEDERAVLGNDYSIARVLRGRATDRILKLLRPLTAIDKLTAESKILSIGCRFEGDLLYLVGYGFPPENVRGMDMISYSPWIDVGNMHKMDYPDDTWDATVLGWVLSYSDNPAHAAQELMRVTRDGGIIAIGVTYYPHAVLAKMHKTNEIGSDPDRIQTTGRILKLFEPHIDHVYWRHDVADPNQQGPCTVIFSIAKTPNKDVGGESGEKN
jgi:SAM-dependent methyltransferase